MLLGNYGTHITHVLLKYKVLANAFSCYYPTLLDHQSIREFNKSTCLMRLLVNCPSGESRLLQVDDSATVLDLKCTLYQEEGERSLF